MIFSLTWPGRASDHKGTTPMGEQASCTQSAVNPYRASNEVADGIISCWSRQHEQRRAKKKNYFCPICPLHISSLHTPTPFFLQENGCARVSYPPYKDVGTLNKFGQKITYISLISRSVPTRRSQRRSNKSFAFY